MSNNVKRFLVRYRTNDGSKKSLLLDAVNQRDARIVAMESNAYVRRFPNSVDTILQAA